MFREFKGFVLLAFGAFAVADSYLGIVQKSTGPVRWLYFGLGLYLVIRGLFILRPLVQKRIAAGKETEKTHEQA